MSARLRILALLALAAFALHGCNGSNSAAKQATVALATVFGGLSFTQPVGIHQSPADQDVWFVLQKAGQVLMVDAGVAPVAAHTVLDLSGTVDAAFEGGLLGMAFHPSFSGSGDVFLYYTVDGSPMVSRLSRFHMAPDGSIDPGSESLVLAVDQPAENHNGGCIAFGPDGYLYVGLGDGGGAGDPFGNGQDTTTLLGAILRIDVGPAPYAIPAGNVFAASSTDRGEIYAWGLRNPWRFSFDRSTGSLWAGDVGQNAWEEIDLIQNGGNYGWNIKEGDHCYAVTPCDDPSLTDPVAEYDHSEGRSVTGGYVYRGSSLPSVAGMYIFGDFVSGRIWGLDAAQPSSGKQLLASTPLNIVSFAEDQAGELYVVDYGGGVYRITSPP
ncbi:MAG: PQQ-dependent sugar dehydrogenase [bacterium]|nr:MAG: PQQ-dependent sugar dehydrogenase [bacterium]